MANNPAPGAPGIPARWTSSAKSGVGTALTAQSRVWYTISHGILNEIYYPRVDYACTRDFGFIVTNGRDYFSEEKRHTRSTIWPIEDGGAPAFSLTERRRRWPLSDREDDLLRSQPRCGATADAVHRARRRQRLSSLRAAVAASRQSRRRQHRLARRLQRRGDAVRERPPQRVGAGSRSVPWRARSVGFVGKIRWLAGFVAAFLRSTWH